MQTHEVYTHRRFTTPCKVKSVKCRTTVTELVVVWSLCSVCTSMIKSKVVTLKHFTLFAIAIARSRKISVILEYNIIILY